jgi:hypothetical protein
MAATSTATTRTGDGMALRQLRNEALTESAPDPALAAVTTWRYLRLAMVLLIVGLAASVIYERLRVPADCWQESISAYYFTPVRAFLVGTLISTGICMVALKGQTAGEDVVLNLAGACAPFVALVPVPDAGDCGTVVVSAAERDLSIANNVFALLVVATLALVVAIGLTITDHRRAGTSPSLSEKCGLGLSAVVLAAAVLVYALAEQWLIDYGHYVAAVAMFALFFADVCLNAYLMGRADRAGRRPLRRVNRYATIAALMVGWVLLNVVLWLAGWDLWLLTLEAGLIALFAGFWLLQTVELWNQGLRTISPSVPDPAVVR